MATFTGGNDDDTFVGGIDPDQATGGGGNDILFGLGGNDTLDGGIGDDALDGGAGDDVLTGGTGRDSLSGGNGNDRLYSLADPGNYQTPYYGNPGTPPVLDRASEADTLSGGAGDDFISAGYGDSVDGGAGNDTLMISFAAATSGVTADFRPLASQGSVTVGGATISGIEAISWIEGSDYGDLLAVGGNYSFAAPIFGMGGDDTIIAGYYSGEIYGGTGNDTIDTTQSGYGYGAHGEAGDDVITGNNLLDGGDGNDLLTVTGTYGGVARGGAGSDTIVDSDGSDQLSGDAGNDTITGAGGNDQIDGGDGNDLIYGDYDPSGNATPPPYLSMDDRITGGAGDDTIYGQLGNDTIDSGADNDTVYGGSGNDTLSGGAGNDLMDGGLGDDTLYGGDGDDLLISGDGTDQLTGEAGDDRLYFGASFGPGDLAAGGAGSDQLILQGNYSTAVTLSATNMIAIETVRLLSAADTSFGGAAAGSTFGYRLVLADSAIASGAALAVDAGGLAAGETLTLDGSAEANGRFTITGGAGDDTLAGGAGADSFFLQKGGADHASGGGGDDGFFFGGALTAADGVDGGTGNDTVALQGDYATGLTLGGIANVEFLSLLSGSITQFGEPGTNRYSYALTTSDANVAAGQTLTVQATGLLATEALTFNGAAETNGGFAIFAGQGNDTLTGGAGSDGFFFGADSNLTAADRIDGGAGTDSIALRGNYALTLQDATFHNVETLVMLSGHSNQYGGALVAAGFDYDVTLANGNVAAGQNLDVIATGLGADESFRFDGRAETDGTFRILSGAGDDSLFGGAGADTLSGGLGKDRLEGGAGADTYVFRSAAESTSTGYDAIIGFDWHVDRIDAPGSNARGFSQSAGGSLSAASFDADLAAALNGLLGAGQAALFTADAGTLSGHIFAVIDVNGAAGYQAGQDLVIELIAPILPIDPAAAVIV